MAEEKTDYVALFIVGAVALMAIVMMYVYSHPAEASYQQRFDGSVLTANVAAAPVHYGTVAHVYDFDGDGKLTKQDSVALADAIASHQCPLNRDCDFNNDGMLTRADLGAFNGWLGKELEEPEKKPAAQKRATTRKSRSYSASVYLA